MWTLTTQPSYPLTFSPWLGIFFCTNHQEVQSWTSCCAEVPSWLGRKPGECHVKETDRHLRPLPPYPQMWTRHLQPFSTVCCATQHFLPTPPNQLTSNCFCSSRIIHMVLQLFHNTQWVPRVFFFAIFFKIILVVRLCHSLPVMRPSSTSDTRSLHVVRSVHTVCRASFPLWQSIYFQCSVHITGDTYFSIIKMK